VAESSVVVELEARLNRRLSASEIIFAHETVSVVRDLAQAQHAAKRIWNYNPFVFPLKRITHDVKRSMKHEA
jgi:hypothetical protein